MRENQAGRGGSDDAGRDTRVEVIIVGGGLVGAPLALALAGAGITVAVIERLALDLQQTPRFDGRGTAVAAGSRRILTALGLWDAIVPHAGAIHDIRVSDGVSPLHLHFDGSQEDEPLGHIVENTFLRRAMLQRLAEAPNVRLLAPAALEEARFGPGAVTVRLADGRRIAGDLLIGADGRASKVRAAMGIQARGGSYRQSAIVTAVEHPVPHDNIAHERFLPPGPLALLPLADPHRSSVVWTELPRRAEHLLSLDDAALAEEMTARFGPYLGPLRIIAPRWKWDLGWHHAERYVAPRAVLAGDAAHGIHPIAGQGVNLGWRDLAALAEILVEARRLGLDVGAPNLLARYEAARRPDNLAMLLATDRLNALFATNFAPVRLARDLGLAAVNAMPGLKRAFMRRAMGVNGRQPRLARGLAL